MLYDTHAHVNFAAFKQGYKAVIDSSLAADVWLNNVGTQKSTSEEAVRIANEYERGVYGVVGLHPGHTVFKGEDDQEGLFEQSEDNFDYDFYSKLAQDPKVVGIGECGLDYYRVPDGLSLGDIKIKQHDVFLKHIQLAKETKKTLVIHCRSSKDSNDAYEDLIEILSKNPVQKLEVHSFTGNSDVLTRLLDLGAYIGLNGIITFDKTGVLRDMVAKCPLERIVLETDAPYLAPAPYRGKQNVPEYVKYVAQFVADVKGIKFEQVAEVTTLNSKKLFNV